MSKIRVLPETLANKIAAGEVVERPASVAKELVENSLDAGALHIEVEVVRAGKELIRVADDGEGMSRDDALLAFERHATSKIRDFADLQNIASFGFRGEALPSIASVSRLTLVTRTDADLTGTEVQFNGGRMGQVRDVSWPRGTEVRVRDLFFNVPARRKFLKSEATESYHIGNLVTHYALANPTVAFTLSSNGRDVIRVTAVASLHDRAYQLLGPALIERLVAVEAEAGGITVSGYVSNPQERRSSRDAQYLFVNDRYVKDRALSRAIAEAYRSMMPSGTFPAVVLFVRLPAEHVDVNVHPAKTEVRFHREHEVRQAVVGAIREALAGSTRPVASFPVPLPAPPRSLNQEGVPAPRQQPATDAAIRAQAPLWRGASAAASSRPAAAASPGAATAARRTTAAEIADIAIERLRPLGQIRESFIVATDDEGLLLVDQHVAHERILFERFRAAGGDCVRQRLLIPETIDLTPAQVLALAKIRADLEHAGFELLELSGRTMAITAVPVDLPQSELRSLVLELLDGSDAAGSALACARDEIAASMACKAAIKINMPLTEEKMTWLLQELLATEDPWTCPHGRPIILRYGLRGIEQQFHRR